MVADEDHLQSEHDVVGQSLDREARHPVVARSRWRRPYQHRDVQPTGARRGTRNADIQAGHGVARNRFRRMAEISQWTQILAMSKREIEIAHKFGVPSNIEQYRIRAGEWGSNPGDDYGAFEIPGPCNMILRIIASSGDSEIGIDWEHVSVSCRNRCPNWTEMCYVKDLFWDAEETVMQLHPPRSQWINLHPYCLHLWRPQLEVIPMPPSITVGINPK